MSEDIRTKMEQLERKLAVQKAYLAAEIKFPQGNKIPKEVQTEVIEALKKAAVTLAEGYVVGFEARSSEFTPEQVDVLKMLADRALAKPAKAAEVARPAVPAKAEPVQPIVTDRGTLAQTETVQADLSRLSDYIGHVATLATLEAVPVRQRGKVASGEQVRIEQVQPDGSLHVITPGGVRFNVNPEMLDFQSST